MWHVSQQECHQVNIEAIHDFNTQSRGSKPSQEPILNIAYSDVLNSQTCLFNHAVEKFHAGFFAIDVVNAPYEVLM